MKPEALVSVEKVTHPYFPQGMLQTLNFTVRRGECMALIGANGTGKTTTLNLLAGLIRPTKGHILIQGFDIHKEPLRAKPYLGFLPDTLPLYNELTLIEYLDFVAKLRQIPKQNRIEAIESAIEKVNLKPYHRHLIGTLSKGIKQRIGIAQAILHRPPVLLLDEPTEGLDPEQIEAFQLLLKEYKRDAAIILSTHHIHEVRSISDEALYFSAEGIKSYDLHHCTA